MEFRRLLRSLGRSWWLLVLGILVGGTVASAITYLTQPSYRATATLFVNHRAARGAVTYNDSLLSEELARSYVHMIAQPDVINQVISRLKLSVSTAALSQMITSAVLPNTQLFTITAQAPQANLARDLANTAAEVFIAQDSLVPATERAAGEVQLIQPAEVPVRPDSPKPVLNLVFGALLGLLVMLVIGLIRASLDDRIRTVDDFNNLGALETLSAVMRLNKRNGAPGALLSDRKPRAPAWEAYRLLRANLEFRNFKPHGLTLLVTSAVRKEGRSTMVANLAIMLAQTNTRVLIVDADLRNPSMHRVFKVSNEAGLTEMLNDPSNGDEVTRFIQGTAIRDIAVLPSGPLSIDAREVTNLPHFDELLDRLRLEADVVIIDSPPVLLAVDSLVIAPQAQATLVVVDLTRARATAVGQTVEALKSSGTRLVGAVLNKVNFDGSYYCLASAPPAISFAGDGYRPVRSLREAVVAAPTYEPGIEVRHADS